MSDYPGNPTHVFDAANPDTWGPWKQPDDDKTPTIHWQIDHDGRKVHVKSEFGGHIQFVAVYEGEISEAKLRALNTTLNGYYIDETMAWEQRRNPNPMPKIRIWR